jgi:hypothetical protein
MATQPNEYQCVYNVGLLDDLHNYFPAFLYDSGRFQTPVQVFHYFRTQLNSRFNLPAHGARMAGFAPYSPNENINIPIQTQPRNRVDRSTVNAAAVLMGLLDGSGGILGENSYFYSSAHTASPFIDPVIVRPSRDVISRNTTIQPGSQSPNNSACAICQDTIQVNDVCRKLNACNHVYHKTCIDQWFESNVHCPTCRHDIRETSASAEGEPEEDANANADVAST